MKKLLTLLCALCLAFPAVAANPLVELKTSQGTLLLELYPEQAPKTVANFLHYVKTSFYDGTIFHRVIRDFMIQGGGFTGGMKEKPTAPPIPNEAEYSLKRGLKNQSGSLAMARTSDPNSATAQFFINLRDNDFLDYPGQDGWGYAVFGRVVSGLDVLQRIGAQPVGNAGFHQNVPRTPIVIESARVIENSTSNRKSKP